MHGPVTVVLTVQDSVAFVLGLLLLDVCIIPLPISSGKLNPLKVAAVPPLEDITAQRSSPSCTKLLQGTAVALFTVPATAQLPLQSTNPTLVKVAFAPKGGIPLYIANSLQVVPEAVPITK